MKNEIQLQDFEKIINSTSYVAGLTKGAFLENILEKGNLNKKDSINY